MSKRELTGLPVTQDEHAAVIKALENYSLSVIQQTNDEELGGSQIWVEINNQPYRVTVEKCTGPLKDISGKAKLFQEKAE